MKGRKGRRRKDGEGKEVEGRGRTCGGRTREVTRWKDEKGKEVEGR